MSYVKDLRQMVGHTPLVLNGSSVLIFRPDGHLLLQQRNEPQRRWGLLGGLMDLGESAQETAVREVREESSIELDPHALQLVGVYSGAHHRVVAPNGDVFYAVITAYAVQVGDATPKINNAESTAMGWFALDDLPKPLVSSHEAIIADYRHGKHGGRH